MACFSTSSVRRKLEVIAAPGQFKRYVAFTSYGEENSMAEPKCPDCGVKGLDKIVSEDSKEQNKGGDAWFNIVLCNECGHVYGVFAKHVLSHDMKVPMPRINI